VQESNEDGEERLEVQGSRFEVRGSRSKVQSPLRSGRRGFFLELGVNLRAIFQNKEEEPRAGF